MQINTVAITETTGQWEWPESEALFPVLIAILLLFCPGLPQFDSIYVEEYMYCQTAG